MTPVRVVVNGALGKMGREVIAALCREPGFAPIAAVDLAAEASSLPLPDGRGSVPLATSLSDALAGADAVVDFTNAEGARLAIRVAPPQRVNVVIGSTGISEEVLREADALAREYGVGILVAPNFALGAVVMVHLARQAARFFDYADLMEMHHEAKVDAPSGTALAIARAAAQGHGRPFLAPEPEKEILPGTRGGTHEGVTIHSARMPGRVAHHELVFGAPGQTLTLRHDSVSREGFMPGVILAIRDVMARPGLRIGLESALGL